MWSSTHHLLNLRTATHSQFEFPDDDNRFRSERTSFSSLWCTKLCLSACCGVVDAPSYAVLIPFARAGLPSSSRKDKGPQGRGVGRGRCLTDVTFYSLPSCSCIRYPVHFRSMMTRHQSCAASGTFRRPPVINPVQWLGVLLQLAR